MTLARSFVTLALLAAPTLAQGTQIPIPAFNRTYTGSARGLYFQAPTPFVVTGLRVPDETANGFHNVEVFVMPTMPPAYPATGTHPSSFYAVNLPSANIIPLAVLVNQGEWLGVLGACGTGSMLNSYGPDSPQPPFPSNVLGVPVTLDRFLTQSNLITSGGNQPYSTENGFNIGRVEVYVASPVGFASALSSGSGCGGDAPSSFYELFTTGSAFDLSGTSMTMIRSAPAYLVVPVATFGFVAPTGTPVAFGASQSQLFALPGTLTTPQGSFTSVSVCSNGYIELGGTTTTDPTESVNELLNANAPRIAALWDDLNPSTGGQMFVETDPAIPTMLHITWDQVPENGGVGANSFQVSIDTATDMIEINYGAVSAQDALVGYSPGGGADNPGPADLSSMNLSGLQLGTDRPNLELRSVARPVIGATATVELQNIDAAAVSGVVMLGGSSPSIGLGLIGMPGCTLYTDGSLGSVPLPIAGSTAQMSLTTGNDPQFVGLSLELQAFTIVPGENPLGLTASDRMTWTFDIN